MSISVTKVLPNNHRWLRRTEFLERIEMIQKQTSKKQEYETAKSHFEHCGKVLRANEILWNDIWEAQPNPFLKIKEYTSPEQTSMRKPIIDAWVDAKKKYLELAKKQPRIET